MITLYGTSHIAGESVGSMQEVVRDVDPDVVAIELDYLRLSALLQEDQRQARQSYTTYLLPLILKKVQQILGKKTGIVPGTEMKTAFIEASQLGYDVALIDQDIRVTMNKLMQIPLKEKIKLLLSLTVGLLIPIGSLGFQRELKNRGADFDLNRVPDRSLIDRALAYFQRSFPALYRVLVEERNDIMAKRLKIMAEDGYTVLAVVGAGHLQGLKERLNDVRIY